MHNNIVNLLTFIISINRKLEKINSFQGESENEAIEELSNLPFLSTL